MMLARNTSHQGGCLLLFDERLLGNLSLCSRMESFSHLLHRGPVQSLLYARRMEPTGSASIIGSSTQLLKLTITKARIDDLLDQLCGARYFSCLDLAPGFWQIPVHPSSPEKAAFSTPQGLFEFLVMPFGLKNAPSVFRRLMHSVIADLNPRDGRQFVAVYVDDMVVWSPTLTEHLSHLKEVIGRCLERNLKFKLSKCRFMLKEVEYLGHLITADGLKANHKITTAEFPRPDDLKEVPGTYIILSEIHIQFCNNCPATLSSYSQGSVIHLVSGV